MRAVVFVWRALSLLLLLAAAAAASEGGPQAPPPEGTPNYERHIRPIFKAYCFHCHGEEKELAGGLDLRLRRLVARGGDSGEAIVLGDHASSLLYSYVASGEMPPAEEQRLSETQLDLIARWIDGGAPTLHPEEEEDPRPGEFVITSDERSHWAFRAIEKPALPVLPDSVLAGENAAATNPLDLFIAEKLHAQGLAFSPPADKLTLLRRATFALLGLPPTPEQIDAFVADRSPDAYARLIDRLLESPRYGERWGRHWLDVVGYADSEGYDDADVPRPDAWRYRDYVIRSFNADKPWNEFIIEQLAGDELVRATHASAQGVANKDPDACDKLTATGFLRMAPDGTGSSPMDVKLARRQVVAETVKIVSSSLLGMTVGCAECHDHRFDPIPQEDFYRLQAIFDPVYDAENWRNPNIRRAAILSEADQQRAAELEAEAKQLDAQHDTLKNEVLQTILERVLEGVPAEQREFARTAFETPVAQQTEEQKHFVTEVVPMLGLLRPGTLHLFLARYKDGDQLKQGFEAALAEAAKIRAQKPAPDYIRVATEDVKHVPETFLLYRGDINSPEPGAISPGDLTVLGRRVKKPDVASVSATASDPVSGELPAVGAGEAATAEESTELDNTFPLNDPSLPTTGRRLAFARHLTNGRHPLLARVLVNRFWQHHFGRGLVDSPGDFGLRATPPSHPELLDYLAADFMEQGWSLKRFHKLVMTSRTYQPSSVRRPEAEGVDADNRLLWRMPVRRLEAEAVRDAILAASGELNEGLYGAPIPVAANEGGIITVGGDAVSPDRRELKRSVYIQFRRTQPVAMLEAFDVPELEPNCEQRVSSTVATQSLALMNSDFVLQQSLAFADRVLAAENAAAAGDDDASIIRAWRIALGSTPGEPQLAALRTFLQTQTAAFESQKVQQPRRQALAALCQVLLGSNAFLYVD